MVAITVSGPGESVVVSGSTGPGRRLSTGQLKLLRFLADRDPQPRCVVNSTYDALINHGLVEQVKRNVCVATKAGLAVLDALAETESQEAATDDGTGHSGQQEDEQDER
jgi:hypothetical protein